MLRLSGIIGLSLALLPWLLGARAVQPTYQLSFTAEERAWLAGHPEVTVAFSESFPPYSLPGSDGQMVGMDLDYLNLITARTGLKFRLVVVKKWSEAIEQFKAGRVQMLTGLIRTPEREAYILFPRPYMFAPDVIVTRTDMPYVLEVSELEQLSVGAVHGAANEQWDRLRQIGPSRVKEFDTMSEVFTALSRGTIDVTITDAVNAAYLIKSLHLSNLRLGSVVGGPGATYFGITPQEPLLAGIIDKTLATLTSQEKRAIDERWIALDLAPSKWLLAFKLAAGLAGLAVVIFLLALLHNRRLAVELAERRRIQAELEVTHMNLARTSEEKSELLRMVAHDLRSPLTGILLNTDLLQYEVDAAKPAIQETLGQIRNSTRQMMRLTNDLVDVHMLEEGKRDFVWAEVDFGILLHEAVAGYSERAARKKIQLRLDCEPRVHALRSDASALRQVTDNLISNALKYSPANTEVLVSLRAAAAGYRLTIRDQGPGIAPADQEKLFQKYVRGSAQPTGGEKTTGLGLWIVRRFVDGLHGRVWYEPGPEGRGTDFIVEVPLAPPAAA